MHRSSIMIFTRQFRNVASTSYPKVIKTKLSRCKRATAPSSHDSNKHGNNHAYCTIHPFSTLLRSSNPIFNRVTKFSSNNLRRTIMSDAKQPPPEEPVDENTVLDEDGKPLTKSGLKKLQKKQEKERAKKETADRVAAEKQARDDADAANDISKLQDRYGKLAMNQSASRSGIILDSSHYQDWSGPQSRISNRPWSALASSSAPASKTSVNLETSLRLSSSGKRSIRSRPWFAWMRQ
jgi:hypothetical protein